MQRSAVFQELQAFARKHGLPEPLVKEDADGRHAFLYSRDKTRRYAYSLTWAPNQPHLLWVMLNPGTGETEGRRRSTYERCKRWARSMGYCGVIFGNVFSLRSKSGKDLLRLPQPSDDLNKKALEFLSTLATEIIVAWGNYGAKSVDATFLRATLSGAKCFGCTESGQPLHPLYVPTSTPLIAW